MKAPHSAVTLKLASAVVALAGLGFGLSGFGNSPHPGDVAMTASYDGYAAQAAVSHYYDGALSIAALAFSALIYGLGSLITKIGHIEEQLQSELARRQPMA
jgi:hypothetical protein